MSKKEVNYEENKEYIWKKSPQNGTNGLILEIFGCESNSRFSVQSGDFICIRGDTKEKPYIALLLELFAKNNQKHAKINWFFLPSEIPKSKLKSYKFLDNEVFYDSMQKSDTIDAETIVGKCNVKWTTENTNKKSNKKGEYVLKSKYNGKTIQALNANPLLVKKSDSHTEMKTIKIPLNDISKQTTNDRNTPKRKLNNSKKETFVSPIKSDEDLVTRVDITSPLNASSYGKFDASFVALNLIQDETEVETIKFTTPARSKSNKIKNSTKAPKNSIVENKELGKKSKTIKVDKKKVKKVETKKYKSDTDDRLNQINASSAKTASVRKSARKVPKLVISKNKIPIPTFDGNDNDSSDYSESSESSESEEEVVYTPKVTRSARKPNQPKSAYKTPQMSRLKKENSVTPIVIKIPGNATPYIRARPTPARPVKNVLEKARTLLHVSATPESLPCREEEFQEIFGFVQGMIESGSGGCMYVSGVPGTGKTATVNEVMDYLQTSAEEGEIPKFLFANINGMSLTEPRHAYVQLLQQITGEKLSPNMAVERLSELFSQRRKLSIVLLADELDLLWTKKQDVMYHLFDWPTNRHAKFIVVAVANTMDLPERMLMNRVASRLGLTRLTFKPYSFKQLQQIVASRLQGIDIFEPDAIQLVSRKVAAVSGDARRCLDICRRATEICEQAKVKRVTIEHVHQALQEMFATPLIKAIRAASVQEQVFLRAVTAEFRRLGVEEATLGQISVQHKVLAQLEGLPPISNSTILMMASNLSTCRLILMEGGGRDLYSRIRLNLSVDDVLFALNC